MNPTIFFIVGLSVAIIAFWVVVGIRTKKRNGTNSTSSVTHSYVDRDKEAQKLLKLAEGGDAEAQFKLAQTFEFKESDKYMYWLEKSAAQGYEQAIREIADEYDYGSDVAVPPIKKDRKKAIEYFTILADKGDIEAMNRISLIYFVEYNDEEKAREWKERAANAGDTEAMIELGNDYRLIEDIADFDKSEYWYKKATDLGDGGAMKGLGDLYCYDEKRSDYFKAESWYNKAVAAGYHFAYVRLGEMCKEGKGRARDDSAAFEYFKKAADKGEIYGKIHLAEAYISGAGVNKDAKKGVSILEEATKESSLAKYRLGLCYYEGEGVEKDYKRAVQLFTECNKFDRDAQYKLGECYFNGYGVKADKQKAKELWRKSAKCGNKDAAECLKIYFGETAE